MTLYIIFSVAFTLVFITLELTRYVALKYSYKKDRDVLFIVKHVRHAFLLVLTSLNALTSSTNFSAVHESTLKLLTPKHPRCAIGNNMHKTCI